jgi:hypothetical protein
VLHLLKKFRNFGVYSPPAGCIRFLTQKRIHPVSKTNTPLFGGEYTPFQKRILPFSGANTPRFGVQKSSEKYALKSLEIGEKKQKKQ